MINHQLYFEAMVNLGYESFSVEDDGTVWLGTESDKTFVDPEIVRAEVERLRAETGR